jgi:hypothetical protein
MLDRLSSRALLFAALLLPVAGCTSSQVDEIAVSPSTQGVSVGQTVQFTAYGLTGHGSNHPGTVSDITNQVTWTSSAPSVATISAAGVATGVSAGTTTISASINGFTGLLTATATLTVSGGSGAGTGSTSGVTAITVTPGAQTVAAPGDTAQFIAVGTTSTGSVNLTNQVSWQSSSQQIATVNAAGLATGVGQGTTTISAQYTNPNGGSTVLGSASFTVTSGGGGGGGSITDITSLTVIPGAQSVPAPGNQATYIAVGTTGSGSTVSMQGLVAWNSSSTQIATINAQTGVATGVVPGTTTIIAQYTNADKTIATGTATFTVSGTGSTNTDITQVTITPSSQTVASPGSTATYTATGTTAGGVTKSLTGVVWSASSPQIATIAATGVATAVGQGTTTISAQYTNADQTVATGTATFTVTGSGSANNDITSITVLPSSQSVPAPNDTANFVAIGTYSSGATVSMQGLATWSSSSPQIATINSQTGVATGVGQGTATITAQFLNADKTIATGTASFTVTAGTAQQYTGVEIIPSAMTLGAGETGQFVALATQGATGLDVDVSSSPQITWQSSNSVIASVTNTGLVTGRGVGNTTITVELQNTNSGTIVTNTASVSATNIPAPEPIVALNVIPSSITVNDFQLTGQFLAIATYSNPPYVKDVTNDPATTWISTEPEMFPVDTNSGGTSGASAGLVTAYASGGAVIVAEAQSPDKTIETATATFNCPEILPTATTAGSCYPGEPIGATLLETLTVYNEGLNTTNWEITAPSATGTADVIHCGPGWTANGGAGGSVCTATYPVGTVVTLTSPAGAGAFGGWSYNCAPTAAITAGGPNSCQVTLNANDTVGAIIN